MRHALDIAMDIVEKGLFKKIYSLQDVFKLWIFLLTPCFAYFISFFIKKKVPLKQKIICIIKKPHCMEHERNSAQCDTYWSHRRRGLHSHCSSCCTGCTLCCSGTHSESCTVHRTFPDKTTLPLGKGKRPH